MRGKQWFYQDEKVEAFRQGEELVVLYTRPHMLRIPVTDRQAIDDEVIRMLKMRTGYGRKYFIQEEVGKIIGVSRQMINRRWQVYRNEGLVALLAGEWEKSKITPELLDRLAELVVDNPFVFAHEIKEKLQEEGLCPVISDATLYSALKQMDGRKLMMLMRGKSNKQSPETFTESGYLIERLFRIIEDLLEKVQADVCEAMLDNSLYQQLQRTFRQNIRHRASPTQKDRYIPRKKLRRDCRRKIGFLRQLLGLVLPVEHCPDCHSSQTRFFFRRARGYVNARGQTIQDYSRIYRCLNPRCRTKFFTVPPKGVELYARVHREVKKMTFRWIFHLRGSLGRVCDELAEHGIQVALTTVLRWVKKAGEECVRALDLDDREDWSQPLCIDEKWIKVRGKWNYVFTAVGAESSDLLAIDLFHHKDRQAMKSFLLQLKAMGFRPISITTDLLLGYEGVVAEVFPDCIYHQCVLHAGRDARRIVRQSLPDDGEDGWRKRLTRRICTLFGSKKLKQVKKRYARFMSLKEKAPEAVSGVFDMVQKYYPKLCLLATCTDIPKTTNPVERAIGEFEERYHITKGFTSFYYAQFFLKAFQVYYRLRKIGFGPFCRRSRLELKASPLGKLHFADYLTPTYA
jgi:transposase-like protein